MSRTVLCKNSKELPGLEKPPYPGQLGQMIYDSISQEAWEQWMVYQTKLINELKLKVFQKKLNKLWPTTQKSSSLETKNLKIPRP
ncbi:MAG: oxidative damage protection protein [Bdellovibrionota bacterium]